MERLAAHGTLRPGQRNHGQVAGLWGRWFTLSVRGRLLPFGWGAGCGFPGLVLDDAGAMIPVEALESMDLATHIGTGLTHSRATNIAGSACGWQPTMARSRPSSTSWHRRSPGSGASVRGRNRGPGLKPARITNASAGRSYGELTGGRGSSRVSSTRTRTPGEREGHHDG